MVSKVYRGAGSLKAPAPELPARFLQPDAFNSKGGCEIGFMSTTTDKKVATEYAHTQGVIFEIELGLVRRALCSRPCLRPPTQSLQTRSAPHPLPYASRLRFHFSSQVDRGAELMKFSQYPHEAEVTWPPLTALSYVDHYVTKGKHIVNIQLQAGLRPPPDLTAPMCRRARGFTPLTAAHHQAILSGVIAISLCTSSPFPAHSPLPTAVASQPTITQKSTPPITEVPTTFIDLSTGVAEWRCEPPAGRLCLVDAGSPHQLFFDLREVQRLKRGEPMRLTLAENARYGIVLNAYNELHLAAGAPRSS